MSMVSERAVKHIEQPISPHSGESTAALPTRNGRSGLSPLWRGVALIALAIAVFANGWKAPFYLDDNEFLERRPAVRTLSTAWQSLPTRRLGTLTFALNYRLHGLDPRGFRAVNIVIHGLAACALFGFARRTLLLPGIAERYARRADGLAWAIAALWLVHPLQTGSVTYVVQRFESLMGLFFLLALYALSRAGTGRDKAVTGDIASGDVASGDVANGDVASGGVASGGVAGEAGALPRGESPGALAMGSSVGSSWRWLAASLACLACAAQTKEIAAMFPVVALAYDRAFFARGWREVFRLRGWFHLAAVAIAAWMVYQFRGALLPERAASAGFGVASVTPWEYFRSQAGVLVHYLWLSVWPRTLCLDYRWPVAQAPWDIYAPGVLILTLLGLTAWALWKAPRWGFLGVCFFVILAPTSSIMPIADLAFEHRLYLPLAALTAVVVLAVGGIPDRNVPSMGGDDAKPPIDSPWPSGGTMIRCALLGTVLATLSARTFVRNRDYLDPVRMWNSVLAVSPWNYRAHNQLALQYEQRGRLDEAERHFQETLRHRPDAWWVDIGLGNLRARQNRLEDAERHFRRAAEQNAGVGLAAANLGRLREREKKWAEAVAFYKVAVARNPSHLDVWLAKGQAHEQLQQVEEATAAYRYVLERDPRSMEAKRGLARCHSAVPR